MSGRANLLLPILAACLAQACVAPTLMQADDATIVIVRHGEKPLLGLGQLSCKGLNRSLALAPLLISRYGKPISIYAPNPSIKKLDMGASFAYVRPLATIEPLAIRAGLPVNLEWGMTDTHRVATALLAQNGGTQVVAWEHHLAPGLAKELLVALGSNQAQVPEWDDKDFDSIFVIRITGHGRDRHAVFSVEKEGLDQVPDQCSP